MGRCYQDGAGVRHWREFGTKREAEAFLDQERPRARQQTARTMVPVRVTLKDYALTHWLPVAVDERPKLKPASKFHYRRVMEKFWIPAVGHVQLRKLQRGTIRDLLLAELGRGRASNTVALYLGVLVNMLRWAVREDHVLVDNPAAALGEQLGPTRERARGRARLRPGGADPLPRRRARARPALLPDLLHHEPHRAPAE